MICGLSLAGLASVPAYAQDSSTDVDAVVITGSRLIRQDFEAISPVTTVDSERLELTATTTVEGFLNQLPQVVPGNNYSSNNAGGEDFSTVDLRGLGPQRTLVLVNGERVPASSTTGVVDLNTIPVGLIDRVEVVTGGASAVYGSDAIAGVTNFILKSNYEGAEANISYGSSFGGKAEELQINTLFGGNFADGRGNATIYADYYTRDSVSQSEFEYSRVSGTIVNTIDASGNFKTDVVHSAQEFADLRAAAIAAGGSVTTGFYGGGGSATPPWGYFTSPGNNFGGVTPLTAQPRNTANFTAYDSDCNPATAAATSATASTVSFNSAGQLAPRFTAGACAVPDRAAGSSRYNFAPDNSLILPAERIVLNSTVRYDISDTVTAKVTLNYVNSKTTVQLAPTPVTGDFAAGVPVRMTPAMQALIFANHRDFYDALQSRANPLGNVNAFFRTNGIGPRIGDNENNSFSLLATIDGAFNDTWDWSLTASYGQNRFDQRLQNNAGRTQLIQGLSGCQNMDGSTLTGVLPGCVALDIFGDGNLTAAMQDFIRVNTSESRAFEESRVAGFVRGELFTLPAGPVSTVVGFEYRDSSAQVRVDDAQKNGDIFGFNATQDQGGTIDVYELYAEAGVPLVKDTPGVEYLGLELGVRASNYSTIGQTTTFKVGLEYAPVEWLKFRSIYNEATRAPSVVELFLNGDQGFPSYADPCNNTVLADLDAATQAACLAQGVPVGTLPGFSQTNSQVQAFAFGNPDLKQEEAKTLTFGAVFQPDWFPVGNLRATVDYYNIKIADAISSRGAQTIINSCFNGVAVDCARITRDAFSGQIGSVDTTIGNLSEFNLKGIDINTEWTYDLGPGRLRLQELISFLDTYEFNGTNYAGTTEGAIGTAYPDYKSVFSATYKWGDFTVFGQWSYTPSMKQDAPGLTFEGAGAPDTPAASYIDLSARWDVTDQFQLTGFIGNLFDEDPPITATGTFNGQAGTDVQVYRVLGRTFSVAAKLRF